MNYIFWCFVTKEEDKPSRESELAKLDNILNAIEMKIKSLEYQCREHTLKAQRLKNQWSVSYAKTELIMRNTKQITLEKWNNIYLKMFMIQHQIEDTYSLEEITNGIKLANTILQVALAKLDPNDIQNLMDDFEYNSEQMSEINQIISSRSIYMDFDPDKALQELQEVEEEKKQEKKEIITTKQKELVTF